MEIKLTASYVLTDAHSKSLLKMPVLVNLKTNEAYNPSDLLEAYPSWGSMQARDVVNRIINGKSFSDQEKFFIERFTWEKTLRTCCSHNRFFMLIQTRLECL
jgi:hypothetical protein